MIENKFTFPKVQSETSRVTSDVEVARKNVGSKRGLDSRPLHSPDTHKAVLEVGTATAGV